MNNVEEPDATTQQARDSVIQPDTTSINSAGDEEADQTVAVPQPDSTSLDSVDTQTSPKLDFNQWLIKNKISKYYYDNLLSKHYVSKLTCEEILALVDYDLSEMPCHFYPFIATKLDSLLKDESVSSVNKNKLLNFTKTFLDSLKKSQYSFDNADTMKCYDMLVPYLEASQMIEVGILAPDAIETNPIPLTKTVTKMSELENERKFHKISRLNGAEYIDTEGLIGYSVKNNVSQKFLNTYLRLNSIYAHEDFYQGRYKELACFQLVDIEDDIAGEQTKIMMFKPIPNAEPLGEDEKIPHSDLNNLMKIGYFFHDIKPEHFVKVFNSNTNKYEYIPTTARYIAQKDSGSTRSKLIRHAKLNKEKIYQSPMNISFSK